jgi:hypothetical protein
MGKTPAVLLIPRPPTPSPSESMQSIMVELREETCKRISTFGLKGESYDTIINRLLDQIILLRELRSVRSEPAGEYTIP